MGVMLKEKVKRERERERERKRKKEREIKEKEKHKQQDIEQETVQMAFMQQFYIQPFSVTELFASVLPVAPSLRRARVCYQSHLSG